MNKYYTGIGSRETPIQILNQMGQIAKYLSSKDYILRSGHAGGADLAFEESATKAEIWLPWRKFNYGTATKLEGHIHKIIKKNDATAYASVNIFHPSPEKLTQGAIALMARNYRQVVGIYPDPNSNFVICWTKDGKASGGTGQAIRLANYLNIPVYNLYHIGIFEKCLTL